MLFKSLLDFDIETNFVVNNNIDARIANNDVSIDFDISTIVLDTKFILSKLTKKTLRQQTQIELHNIDKEENLDINTNTNTTIDIRRANRSKDNLLFILIILRKKIYKEITNKKIEKSIKDSNSRIFSKSKKHNKKI